MLESWVERPRANALLLDLHHRWVVGLFVVFLVTMLITSTMIANWICEVFATNVVSTIHNHEVAGSCPALTTVNK